MTCKGTNTLVASEEHSMTCASTGVINRAHVLVSRERVTSVCTMCVNRNWRWVPWNAGNPMEELFARVITRSTSREHILFPSNGNLHSHLGSMLVHATTEQRRTPPCPMVRRCEPVVYRVGDCTLVTGGYRYHTGDHLASGEIFDPSRNVWTSLPDMPHTVSSATASVISLKVKVDGGKSWHERLTCLQIYDTMLESRELGPHIPEYLTMASAAVFGGKLCSMKRLETGYNVYVCADFIPEVREWKYTASIGTPGLLTGNPRP